MQIFTPRIANKRLIAMIGSMVLLSFSLSACVSNYSLGKDAIGTTADLENPPKLVGISSNPKDLDWDKPRAFGPVPPDQQQAGNKICLQLGKDVFALGYNPKALDVNGNPIKGGGFLCTRKQP